jgi:hypothetical protein
LCNISGLNGQFFDPEIGHMRVVNLSCNEVNDRHTSSNIKSWLLKEIEDYKIDLNQIFVLSVDSAANITKAVRDLTAHLNQKVVALMEDLSELGEEQK